MKRIRSCHYFGFAIFSCLFLIAAEAPAPLMSPGEIDLYRLLGLRLEEKVGHQNARQLRCIVEDPGHLKKLGMADATTGDKVLLIEKDKDKWLVQNKTNGSAVSVEAAIREFYDYDKPKL